MTEHLTKSQTERFCARALPEADLTSMGQHLAECNQCHRQFTERLGSQTSEDFGFTLSPEHWFRHDHLDFEQLVSLADKTLNQSERELIDIHLRACEACREDVRSFIAFREKTDRELDISYASIRRQPDATSTPGVPWWPRLASRPTYAMAVIALVVILTAIVAILVKRRTEPLEAKRTEPNQIGVVPTPIPTVSVAASNSSPSPESVGTPTPIDDSSLVATLRDGNREITLDRGGHVSGLDDVAEVTRREIADALLAEKIERPTVLNDIAGQSSALRGPTSAKTFRLLSPGRSVIVDDRPTFKWEKLAGASSYRVYVGDSLGREIAQSQELTSEQMMWRVPKPLDRNQVYSWNVVATIDGNEVASPGPSSPEMKFRVLSLGEFQKIEQLKKTRSHLSLGVAYAKAGLVSEAEKEFQTLVQLNPESQLARKLLRSVRAMRNSKGE